MEHLPIWYLEQLPDDIIDAAKAEFSLLPSIDAGMGEINQSNNHGFRDTTIRFAPEDHWFGETLYEVAKTGNTVCGWNYDITGHEAVQYGEYGPSQHYNWHMDNFPLTPKQTDRKLSISCLMNDPSEYEGGEFELRLYEDFRPPLKKGTVFVFPSILYHRVVPVLTGLRTSSVLWITGPRFR